MTPSLPSQLNDVDGDGRLGVEEAIENQERFAHVEISLLCRF